MLTLRKITVPVGDAIRAGRRARYVLDATEAPAAFARDGGRREGGASDGNGTSPPSAIWLGTQAALGALGLERARPVTHRDLVMALQGRHAGSGEQVRRPGPVVRLRRDRRGGQVRDVVRGVASIDLTFSAPKSVSVVWSQADPELRASIERAMVTAADAVLAYMVETKPVVMMGRNQSRQKLYGPARGFAAAAALHVTSRRARGENVPSPQLHVHGVLVGAQREGGGVAGTESAALFKHGAPLEGGAAGRAVLALRLVELGFEVDPSTGTGGRFFEVAGVPSALIAAMSTRARDVRREIARIETARGKAMGGRERAVVALTTRAPKGTAVAEIAAAWDALCGRLDFGPSDVVALCRRSRRTPSLAKRRAAVQAALERRMREQRSGASNGSLRTIAFECAAGRLGLAQAQALLGEMSVADAADRTMARRIRALEERALRAATGVG